MYSAPGTSVSTPGGSPGQYGYTLVNPNSTASSTVGYTGATGVKSVIMGYCLEVDTDLYPNYPAALVAASGYRSAELDCDNGSNAKGNSSISTIQTLSAGYYELRYFYNSRVNYADYNPTYICGSTASDLAWANDTNTSFISNSSSANVPDGSRTNQINVYLDKDASGKPPTHQTIDGTQYLGGSNLIDACVYTGSFNWIERSVRIYVNTSGSYWLSSRPTARTTGLAARSPTFACARAPAPGRCRTISRRVGRRRPTYSRIRSESDLFLLDERRQRLCQHKRQYQQQPGHERGKRRLAEFRRERVGGGQGQPNRLCHEDPSPGRAGARDQRNDVGFDDDAQKLISRPFLLDPGYYQVSYDYLSEITFSSLNGVYCGATPSAANIAALSAQYGPGIIHAYGISTGGSIYYDTNTVGVFMSHAQLASTPNLTSSLGATTTYTNPNGTTSTTPTVAPNGISLTSYNASQVNPLLDICGYATSWHLRRAFVAMNHGATSFRRSRCCDSGPGCRDPAAEMAPRRRLLRNAARRKIGQFETFVDGHAVVPHDNRILCFLSGVVESRRSEVYVISLPRQRRIAHVDGRRFDRIEPATLVVFSFQSE